MLKNLPGMYCLEREKPNSNANYLSPVQYCKSSRAPWVFFFSFFFLFSFFPFHVFFRFFSIFRYSFFPFFFFLRFRFILSVFRFFRFFIWLLYCARASAIGKPLAAGSAVSMTVTHSINEWVNQSIDRSLNPSMCHCCCMYAYVRITWQDMLEKQTMSPKKPGHGHKGVVDVVLGAQWGDEGKGKLVSFCLFVCFFLLIATLRLPKPTGPTNSRWSRSLVVRRQIDKRRAKKTYGVVCFSVFLSLIIKATAVNVFL